MNDIEMLEHYKNENKKYDKATEDAETQLNKDIINAEKELNKDEIDYDEYEKIISFFIRMYTNKITYYQTMICIYNQKTIELMKENLGE